MSLGIFPRHPPGLTFKAELFESEAATVSSLPMQVSDVHDPSARHLLIPITGQPAAVKLTMTDIFGQSTSPVVIPITAAAVRPAVNYDAATTPGIQYQLYHQDQQRKENYFNPPAQAPDESHYWLTLDELAKGKVVRQGISRGFDLSIRQGRENGYAIVFEGLLDVPVEGAYVSMLRSMVRIV